MKVLFITIVSLNDSVSSLVKCYVSQVIALLVFNDVLQFESLKHGELKRAERGIMIDGQILQ